MPLNLQNSPNQTMFALSFRNASISNDRFMRFLRPLVSMPRKENMRLMNACDAGAAIMSSAKAAILLNASRLFCQKINASDVAFLSAASAR